MEQHTIAFLPLSPHKEKHWLQSNVLSTYNALTQPNVEEVEPSEPFVSMLAQKLRSFLISPCFFNLLYLIFFHQLMFKD